jgi:small subunit ribosomal protein S12
MISIYICCLLILILTYNPLNYNLATIYVRYALKKKKKENSRTPGLVMKLGGVKKSPQHKGIVFRVCIVTPKKPNSARRQVVKAAFVGNTKSVLSYVPGIGHNLRKHSDVLVRGGGAHDLPGVRYSCIRGVLGLAGVTAKTKRRSIYGVKNETRFSKRTAKLFKRAGII